jgi:hypothetical protein
MISMGYIDISISMQLDLANPGIEANDVNDP